MELTKTDKFTTIFNVVLPVTVVILKLTEVGHFATLSWWAALIPIYLWLIPIAVFTNKFYRELKSKASLAQSEFTSEKDWRLFNTIGSFILKKKDPKVAESAEDQINQ